jgi:alcohol dehydrogenase (cytochrome c)
LLLDVPRQGSTMKALVHPARNGYLWTLERKADGIKFIDAKSYVKQDVFAGIDPETGRPTYNEIRKPIMGKKAEFCPSLWGGKDWPPAAYSPKTGYLYIPANENLCGALTGQENPPYVRGQLWLGVEIKDIVMTVRDNADHIGELQAWDMKRGQKVWTQTFKYHNWGPVLATGGDLIFMGGTNDRYFRAFDAKTGSKLWEYRTNSGITAVPVTYEVDGVQYVAVQSGWGVDAQRMQNRVDQAYGLKTDVPQGGVVWSFAIK